MMKEEIFERDDEIRGELIQASKEIGREQLKERFEALDIPKEKKSYLRMWIAAAAMVAVLIAALFLLKPPSPDAIFSDNYTKFPNKLIPLTRGPTDEKELTFAMMSYKAGDYEELLPQLEALEGTYPEVAIYIGMFYVEQESYNLAVEKLGPLHENKSSAYSEDASWYLALAYLKLDRSEEAQEIFTSLSKYTNEYRERSTSILKDL